MTNGVVMRVSVFPDVAEGVAGSKSTSVELEKEADTALTTESTIVA